jgi:hypothetical protein
MVQRVHQLTRAEARFDIHVCGHGAGVHAAIRAAGRLHADSVADKVRHGGLDHALYGAIRPLALPAKEAFAVKLKFKEYAPHALKIDYAARNCNPAPSHRARRPHNEAMALRYVVLKHVLTHETHFDLMLEVEGQELLRTLQLKAWPLAPGESCAAAEIAPHRRVYLEYEGEISGGRGHVHRVEVGTWNGDITLRPEGAAPVTLRIAAGQATVEG